MAKKKTEPKKATIHRAESAVIRKHRTEVEVQPANTDLEIAELRARLQAAEQRHSDGLMNELRQPSQDGRTPGANTITYASHDAATAERLVQEGKLYRTPFGYMDASRKGWGF